MQWVTQIAVVTMRRHAMPRGCASAQQIWAEVRRNFGWLQGDNGITTGSDLLASSRDDGSSNEGNLGGGAAQATEEARTGEVKAVASTLADDGGTARMWWNSGGN